MVVFTVNEPGSVFQFNPFQKLHENEYFTMKNYYVGFNDESNLADIQSCSQYRNQWKYHIFFDRLLNYCENVYISILHNGNYAFFVPMQLIRKLMNWKLKCCRLHRSQTDRWQFKGYAKKWIDFTGVFTCIEKLLCFL